MSKNKEFPHILRSAPTIGFFTHDFTGGYQLTVLSGVVDYAHEHGVNLICFSSGELESIHDYYRNRNILYDMANSRTVDGLIVTSATISNFVGMQGLKKFYNKYHPLPMVSLGLGVEGIPSITIDNQVGLHQMLKHLIVDHGYRRIVFIQGIEGNDDADQRYQIYLDTLAEYGIPLDLDLVVRANFFVTQSIQAIYSLIDRQIPFDAVVAANDEMAIGALEALQNRQKRVPDDVAVAGFDNIEESNFTISPLTTVQQPLYEMGRQAAELLLKQLRGQPIPQQIALPTQAIIRQSCGCFSQSALQASVDDVAPSAETVETLLTTKRQEILSDIVQAASGPMRGIQQGDLEEVLDAYLTAITTGTSALFLSSLDKLGRKIILQGGQAEPLQDVVSILYRWIVSSSISNATLWLRLMNLTQQSRVLVAEITQRTQAYRRLEIRQQAWMLGEFTREMITSSSVEELMTVIAINLPRLGIEACYLVLYEEGKSSFDWGRLAMGFDRQGLIPLQPGGNRFPIVQLMPDGVINFDSPRQLIVESLYFREEQFGYVIFELRKNESLLYEELREQLSSVLKGVTMAEEHKKIEADLLELNQLKTEFISTAAHELRTPLTSIQGFSEILLTRDLDRTRQMRYVTLINQQSAHLAIIINDLLDISRLESKRKLEFALEPINVGNLVTLVINTLGESSTKHHIEVFDMENCPSVTGDPFRVTQVIENLISNAIKYSPDGGKVVVRGKALPGYLQVSIEDEGIGMTPDQQQHLFEKFYRANASNTSINGTGLGLAISKLIIELLGGNIWAESEPGVGTTFFFTLPLFGVPSPG